MSPSISTAIGKIMLRRLSLNYGISSPGSDEFVRRCLIKAARAGTVNLDTLLSASGGDFEHDLFVICGSMNLHTGKMPVGIEIRCAN